MSSASWRSFRQAVRRILGTVKADVWTDTSYQGGEWNGIREQAAVFVAGLPDDAPHDAIRQALASLAEAYGQDAIGLTIGQAELVAPGINLVPSR